MSSTTAKEEMTLQTLLDLMKTEGTTKQAPRKALLFTTSSRPTFPPAIRTTTLGYDERDNYVESQGCTLFSDVVSVFVSVEIYLTRAFGAVWRGHFDRICRVEMLRLQMGPSDEITGCSIRLRTLVRLTLILAVPLSALFSLGRWDFGMNG